MSESIWDERNTPQASDSTSEVIRKHKIFKAAWDKVLKGQRGKDYWGGVDDSIANDLTECDEMLCERAIMRHDREASNYIMDANQVEMMWWIQQKLSKAKEAYALLVEYEADRTADTLLDKARELLKPICPDDYPVNEDGDNE